MNFDVVAVFNRSITIEMKNDDIFEMADSYEIFVDGEKKLESNKNVVSIYGLLPDTTVNLEVKYKGEVSSTKVKMGTESVLLNVKKFGASGDGKTDDTAKIQAAILSCPPDGTVYFPKGTYYVTPLFLKSRMTLWLDEGATILGNTDRNNYPMLPGMTMSTNEKGEYNLSSWEGNPLTSYASLITGIEVSDVDIIGPGVLDGNAENSDWWVNAKVKRGAWRPNTVYFCKCRNMRMQNVTVQNSPSWTVHPYYSDNVEFYNLHISNPDNSPNTDGLDPESCNNVKVLGTVISVGDDCMAIKSGKYYMALNHYKPTEHVTIRNCKLERGHGSVTVGSEAAGGVIDVKVTKCIFDGTDRGLRIKTRRGRGQRSVLDQILFENIKMDGVYMPFTVNMFYFCDPDGHSDYVQNQKEMPVDEMTPVIGSITARNMVCTNAQACMICAYGLPEMPIKKLEFTDIKVSYLDSSKRKPMVPVMMDNFDPMDGRSIYARNIDELVLNNIQVKGSTDSAPELINVASRHIDNLEYINE
ncbi:MAG: glycoside hydrolase family 28 protein [Butyrivibrio sp.]|nr:glycoside hydrolase family 28 protein [Butyrivibrio sp.]